MTVTPDADGPTVEVDASSPVLRLRLGGALDQTSSVRPAADGG